MQNLKRNIKIKAVQCIVFDRLYQIMNLGLFIINLEFIFELKDAYALHILLRNLMH
jgi:hypothetical protein